MPDDLEAIASDTEGFLSQMVRDKRGGMLTGFVLLAEYLDDQGEPCFLTLAPTEQRMVTTIGQARSLMLDIEHRWDQLLTESDNDQ